MADQAICEVYYPLKSESDKCDYRGLVLANGLSVLLVSDPTTEKSAAALTVEVGSLTDPWEIPGLAHFCEHMLFMGTKKYPQENAYTQFLSDHGGYSNASTSDDATCYYFDVTPDNFREALDIFSQFFLDPLFDVSCTEREVNAVDSEYENGVKEDSQRLSRLDDITCDQNHDVAKFGWGNKRTLETIPKENGIDVREALMEFHDKYYSSNIMNLCVLGKESLDELSEMVVEMFGGIDNKNIEPQVWDNPFFAEHLGVEIKLVPVKDIRCMYLKFPIPDLRKEYKCNPGNYLGHIVAHEGQGSLLSFFKAKGWVNSIEAVAEDRVKGVSTFEIYMDLSPAGLENTDSLIHYVFGYLKMLTKHGPDRSFFEECKHLDSMQFRFKPRVDPIDSVMAAVGGMQKYRWEDILCGPYLHDEYKPELITQLLECLTPQNMRVVIVSKDFEGIADNTEQYYGFNYSIEKISEDKINLWNSCEVSEHFHLPEPNVFIPTNFDLCPEQSEYTEQPVLISDEPSHRMWFRQDKEFLLPTNIITLELRNPIAYANPTNSFAFQLIEACFYDANNEYFYPARLAGLYYTLSSGCTGMTLDIQGYNEKQHEMLERVLTRLKNFKINDHRFEILKEASMRDLKNYVADQPHSHSSYFIEVILSEKCWTFDEQLEITDDVTVEKCQMLLSEFLSKLFVEGLVYGNMTVEEAHQISNTVKEILAAESLSAKETRNLQEYELKDGASYEYNYINKVHPTNAITVFYQVGVQHGNDLKLTATNDLFCYILMEPCFNVLRTQEQLGYIVCAQSKHGYGAEGMYIIVQSEKNLMFLIDRIEKFVLEYVKTYLDEMTSDQFENNKRSLVALKLEKAKNLYTKAAEIWCEITQRFYMFDRDDKVAAEISALQKEDILHFYDEKVVNTACRKLLSVKVQSLSNPGDQDGSITSDYIITNITDFKNEHDLIEYDSYI